MNNNLEIKESGLVTRMSDTAKNYKYTLFGVGLITLTTITYKTGIWGKIKNMFY